MYLIASTELHDFSQFVQGKLAAGESQLSLEAALDQWRIEHPTEDEFEEEVRAIQVALDEMDAGERGRPAREVIEELRAELGLRKT